MLVPKRAKFISLLANIKLAALPDIFCTNLITLYEKQSKGDKIKC